ncbi:hypothetical protein SS1G_02924 [Sclerotinia sclerotiorum 1980 UF-70]|uniref:SigF-like NTF2-like domain-containing protein n=2 Tax=Sclerotinia sclerotiorum (strain ATCC 18683 / 1980 / Ss-1) TaxID=665079 RepID=A0A1D9Q266_SCLS1|nr:hypothetical protein SS1G_02924 [Sclerotinia sclerotiorum 1980 UF-70]APA09050.1 hypothetical protein sscle_04g038200 [Sclerotinia sclerotiorum 1980 UF-70]EDO00064.1 hypothetical protein SS1G_02924 [Sclerotinia sclerotiorum 1980 UF-70]
MDHPKSQIVPIIHTLCSGSPSAQKEALETYFTNDASFSHPLCSVPSFSTVRIPVLGEVDSRWVLWCVYRWYKVLSPRIVVEVDGVEYNPETQTLFLQIHQIFHLFFVPFFAPTVYLTTILYLTPSTGRLQSHNHNSFEGSSTGASESRRRTKYLIKHQEDLYQSTEVVKFFWPGGTKVISAWRLFATLLCISGAIIFAPFTWMQEWGWFGNGWDVKEKKKESRGEVNGVNGSNGVNGGRRETRNANGEVRKNR